MWKANSSLVFLPKCLPVELSLVLGTIIGNRLATQESGPWRKALAPLAEYHAQASVKNPKTLVKVPVAAWPLETALLAYPGKRTYGKGELIVWELKLFGESADHGFFLELILPAMEEAGFTSDSRWNRPRQLWGHFDVHAVYVANGPHWEPLVSEGRLDLRYRPTPVQWAEGLAFVPDSQRPFSSLHWLTPFDLAGISSGESEKNLSNNTKDETAHEGPTLQLILDALISRVSRLIPGRHKPHEGVMSILNTAEQASLRNALEEAAHIRLLGKNLMPPDKHWPGAWIGTQTYAPIPAAIIPYLELASILHIGKYTHFGCGTYVLS
jgi:hypothetical protein